MPWVGFEPTISAGERPKTYALDRTATGTGIVQLVGVINGVLCQYYYSIQNTKYISTLKTVIHVNEYLEA